MDQFLFAELTDDQREQQLEAISEGKEEMDYSVLLTQEELTEKKSLLTTCVIKEARLADRKKEVLDEIKEELQPIIEEKKQLLTEIKSGTIQEKGVCFKVVDMNTHLVGYYNRKGMLVYQRPMTMDDRQKVIKMAANS